MGHQWSIWSAFQKSESMCIIVARDKTVAKIKGRPSKNSELDRLERVQTETNSEPNIKVRLGRADGAFWETLKEEAPDKLILGYDQHFKEADILAHFPNLKIERATAYAPEIFKSSKF